MRLTLRIVLAYLNQVLTPEDSQVVAKQIEQDEQTRQLVRRIEEVQRRVSLMTTQREIPTIDPNLVAEYLDNELTPEEVLDIERVTLESDGNLAEVAACYHILTEVLSGVVSPESSLRQRLCALPQQIELQKQPVATPKQTNLAQQDEPSKQMGPDKQFNFTEPNPSTNRPCLPSQNGPSKRENLSVSNVLPPQNVPLQGQTVRPATTASTTRATEGTNSTRKPDSTRDARMSGTDVTSGTFSRTSVSSLTAPESPWSELSLRSLTPTHTPSSSAKGTDKNTDTVAPVAQNPSEESPESKRSTTLDVDASVSSSGETNLWMGIPVPPPIHSKTENSRPQTPSVAPANVVKSAESGNITESTTAIESAATTESAKSTECLPSQTWTESVKRTETVTSPKQDAATTPRMGDDRVEKPSVVVPPKVLPKTSPKKTSPRESTGTTSSIAWGQQDTEAHRATPLERPSVHTERSSSTSSPSAVTSSVVTPPASPTPPVPPKSKPSPESKDPSRSSKLSEKPPLASDQVDQPTSHSTESQVPSPTSSQSEVPSPSPADHTEDTTTRVENATGKKPSQVVKSTPAFLAHSKPAHTSQSQATKSKTKDMPFGHASVNAPVFDEPEPLSWKAKLLLSLVCLVMLALGGLGTLFWYQAERGEKQLASRQSRKASEEAAETPKASSVNSSKTDSTSDNLASSSQKDAMSQTTETTNSSASEPSTTTKASNAEDSSTTNGSSKEAKEAEAELPEIAAPFGDQNDTSATDANIDFDSFLGPETTDVQTVTQSAEESVSNVSERTTSTGDVAPTVPTSTVPAAEEIAEKISEHTTFSNSTSSKETLPLTTASVPEPNTSENSSPSIVAENEVSLPELTSLEPDIAATNEKSVDTSKPTPPITKPKVVTTPTVPVEDATLPEPESLPTDIDTSDVATVAPAQEVPPAREKIAQLTTQRAMMICMPTEASEMVRISDTTPICLGDRLATLPTYRSTIQIAGALTLDSVGESILQMPDYRASGEGLLRLEYGQFVLRAAPETGLNLRCALGSYRGSLWLANAQTKVAITIIRNVPHTLDPEKTAGYEQVQIACIEGTAAWTSDNQSKVEIGRLRQLSLFMDNGTVSQTDGALEEIPSWTEKQRLTPLEQKASFALENLIRPGSRDLAKTLINIAKYDGKRETQELARRAVRTVGVFTYEIDRLDKSQTPEVGIEEAEIALAALATGVQRSPEQAGQIRTLLEKRFATTGNIIYELLWKYRNIQEPTADQQVELLNYMSHSKTLVRAAAFYDLMQLYPGDTFNYSPEKREALRASAIAKWARKLKLAY